MNALENDCELSEYEYPAAMRMFKRFLRFCQDNDIIDGYDVESLKDFMEERKE